MTSDIERARWLIRAVMLLHRTLGTESGVWLAQISGRQYLFTWDDFGQMNKN